MQKLTEAELAHFRAVVLGGSVENRLFDPAKRKLHTATDASCRPPGVGLDREIPRSLQEWRADPEWSIQFAEKHQTACHAAWIAYWAVKGSTPSSLT